MGSNMKQFMHAAIPTLWGGSHLPKSFKNCSKHRGCSLEHGSIQRLRNYHQEVSQSFHKVKGYQTMLLLWWSWPRSKCMHAQRCSMSCMWQDQTHCTNLPIKMQQTEQNSTSNPRLTSSQSATKPRKILHNTHQVQVKQFTGEESSKEYHLNELGEHYPNPIEVAVSVIRKGLTMEVDTAVAGFSYCWSYQESSARHIKVLPAKYPPEYIHQWEYNLWEVFVYMSCMAAKKQS